jgi:hypothetical protein
MLLATEIEFKRYHSISRNIPEIPTNLRDRPFLQQQPVKQICIIIQFLYSFLK